MSIRKIETLPGKTKLVVAFDVGTTFSGISYCILEEGEIPEINGVMRFPGQGQISGNAKVPSVLYYDESGNVKAAGAEVLTESVIETALTEGWTKAEWWKLYLRPKHLESSISKNDDLPPLPSGKRAVDVLTDFIKYLFQCTKTYIEERHLAFTWSTHEDSIEYIFTHPNGWEGVQQQLYRQAIEAAGLVPATSEGRARVQLLTEGEASLHFCAANLISKQKIDGSGPQGVVIIDAGGGTIDLSMFSTTSNPITCEEIAAAECRLQGSVFVTRRARLLLERKLAGWEHDTPEEIAEFMREFDQTTKVVIKSDKEPAYIKVAGRRTNVPEYNISFGKLKLTGEEATGLFKESFDAIIDAYEEQQKFATTKTTVAFFVGGLSTNDWLWSLLQSYFKAKAIEVRRPDSHINKPVAHGAVLSHIDRDNHKVVTRVVRATYGLVSSVRVRENDAEHVRRRFSWRTDVSGDWWVPRHFDAKLYKGDRVPEKKEIRDRFVRNHLHVSSFGQATVRFACYLGKLSKLEWLDQDDDSSFTTLFEIRADLSTATDDVVQRTKNSGEIYYQLHFEVIVYFGLAEIKAEVCWKTKDGEHRIPAEVVFDD